MKKFGWLIVIWLISLNIGGDNFLIPLRIQAAMFSKIASHDGVLKNKDKIRLLIVFDKSTESLKNDCKKAFSPAFYEVGETYPEKLASVINDYDIVYFMPKLISHASTCRKYNKLSVACVTMAVVNGDITIGLGVVQDLPRLYVNISNLEREGHSLSPNILQIAKVYK